jgi:hypothetical protein
MYWAVQPLLHDEHELLKRKQKLSNSTSSEARFYPSNQLDLMIIDGEEVTMGIASRRRKGCANDPLDLHLHEGLNR